MPKATLATEDGSTKLEFRYNPKELSITKSATWNRPTSKGAKGATKPEFGGVQPQTVQMELFLDDWDNEDRDNTGNLVKDIEVLIGWLSPHKKSVTDKKPQPKALRFHWGDGGPLENFKGFLKSVSAKYTMFNSDGRPVRATVQIALEEIPQEEAKQNPTSGSIAGRRVHVVSAGDSLHSVSFHEYDDPSLWRGLAAFNGINDPLRVRPGTRLQIPTADEAAALSQEG
jgi:nucleoid-associated protein YgaU